MVGLLFSGCDAYEEEVLDETYVLERVDAPRWADPGAPEEMRKGTLPTIIEYHTVPLIGAGHPRVWTVLKGAELELNPDGRFRYVATLQRYENGKFQSACTGWVGGEYAVDGQQVLFDGVNYQERATFSADSLLLPNLLIPNCVVRQDTWLTGAVWTNRSREN